MFWILERNLIIHWVQGCPFDLSGRIDFLKSPFGKVEGRLFFRNLPWKNGREILPSKSPLKIRKGDSPFKISLWKMEGRFSLINLPSEGRKYFLGRIENLPYQNEMMKSTFCYITYVDDFLMVTDIYIDRDYIEQKSVRSENYQN